MVDYSKWKDIEVSDDEDETHPNIDTPSLFRWRHDARLVRMEESRKEKEDLEKAKRDLTKKKKDLEKQKGGDDVVAALAKLSTEEAQLAEKEAELVKKESRTPWNVDTIAADGFSKTVINRKEKGEVKELTEEEKAERFRQFSLQNEKLMKEFGMLRKHEDSRKFLLDYPHLVCDDTTNYLVYWCIDLALEEKYGLMDHISHQCISMQFLLELAKQLDRDPRSCISPFFSKIGHVDHTDYKKAFDSELSMFRARIRKRAEERIKEALEMERKERLGPGMLDPLEVLESLPENMQKCFESQDIPMLQQVLSDMPQTEAAYHMKRCVDSGLWVPNAKDLKKKEDGEEQEEEEGTVEEVLEETEASAVSEQPPKD